VPKLHQPKRVLVLPWTFLFCRGAESNTQELTLSYQFARICNNPSSRQDVCDLGPNSRQKWWSGMQSPLGMTTLKATTRVVHLQQTLKPCVTISRRCELTTSSKDLLLTPAEAVKPCVCMSLACVRVRVRMCMCIMRVRVCMFAYARVGGGKGECACVCACVCVCVRVCV